MKPKTERYLRAACGAVAIILATSLFAAAQTRVVAIGDIHGAYDEFVQDLQHVGLIDVAHQWTGGSTIFVQVGDILDRGPKPREAMDLLMALEEQAPKQNGKVIPLLGNHEAMNMMGDLRYTTAEEFAEYATDQSEKVREKAYQDYLDFLSSNGQKAGNEAARQAWMADHPLGYFEQRDAFAPNGKYGSWLRKRDAVAQVGDALFCHGGLDPKLHFKNIKELNDNIRKDLSTFDHLWEELSQRKIIWRYMRWEEAVRQIQARAAAAQSGMASIDPPTFDLMRKLLELENGPVIYKNGPLWYRGYVQEPAEKLQGDLDKILARLKAHYVVVGHSVTFSETRRVLPLLDNHVFMIDTGMLRAVYQGHPAALNMQDGRITAYYTDSEPVVLVPRNGSAAPATSTSHGEGTKER